MPCAVKFYGYIFVANVLAFVIVARWVEPTGGLMDKYLWYIPGLVGVGIFLWKGLRHIQQQPLVGALYLSVVVVAVLMLARIL